MNHLYDPCRRRQKENQEELLDRVNQATLQMLTRGGAGGGAGAVARKITDIQSYRSVNDMVHNNTLAVQVSFLRHGATATEMP